MQKRFGHFILKSRTKRLPNIFFEVNNKDLLMNPQHYINFTTWGPKDYPTWLLPVKLTLQKILWKNILRSILYSSLFSTNSSNSCRKRNPTSVILLLLTLWTLIRNMWLHHNMNFATNKNSLDISQFVTRVLTEFTEPNKDKEHVNCNNSLI